MMHGHPQLRAALADAMDVVALTDDAVDALVAPILQRILNLRDHGVPEPVVTELLNDLKACCSFNRSMSAKAKDVCGTLDALSRVPGVPTTLTIKSIARTLRPALKVLADPHAHTPAEYVSATRTVDEIATLVPRDRLCSGSLRHELRSRAFRTLTDHLHPRDCVGGRVATIGSAPHLDDGCLGCGRTPAIRCCELGAAR